MIARLVEETAQVDGLVAYFAEVEEGETRRLGGAAAIVTALWTRMDMSW